MSRALRQLCFAGLLLPGILPLIAPYLPFQDWPGHVGVVSALHWHNAGMLPDNYSFQGWLGANRLFYLLSVLVSFVTGPFLASQLVLAIVLAAAAPAGALMIRACGGDWRWALLLVPLVVGRILACGFVPNVAAFGTFLLGLAGLMMVRTEPFKGGILFAAGLVLTIGFHLFVFLALTGLSALGALIYLAWRKWRQAAALLPGLVLSLAISPWLGARSTGSDQGATAKALLDALTWGERSKLLDDFWGWLFAYFRYAKFDDWTQLVWLGALGLAALLGIFSSLRGREWLRVTLAVSMCLASILAFSLIPENIGPPINWWGGNLRIPMLIVVFVIIAASWSRGKASIALRWAGAAAGLVFFVMSSWRIVEFSHDDMENFDALVEAIPEHSHVCAMHYSDKPIHEFPGEPHWYTVNYYLAKKPGLVWQDLFGHQAMPIKRAVEPPHSHWSMGGGFAWSQHFGWCDYLLVRLTDPSRFGIPPNVGAEIIGRAPRWLLLQHRRP